MSKTGYYAVKTKEEKTAVDYIELFDSDSGSAKDQPVVTKENEASFIS